MSLCCGYTIRAAEWEPVDWSEIRFLIFLMLDFYGWTASGWESVAQTGFIPENMTHVKALQPCFTVLHHLSQHTKHLVCASFELGLWWPFLFAFCTRKTENLAFCLKMMIMKLNYLNVLFPTGVL